MVVDTHGSSATARLVSFCPGSVSRLSLDQGKETVGLQAAALLHLDHHVLPLPPHRKPSRQTSLPI